MKNDLDDVYKFTAIIIGLGCISICATYCYKSFYGILGENLTLAIRKRLYTSIIHKHIGWFDFKEHSTGALVDVLAADT